MLNSITGCSSNYVPISTINGLKIEQYKPLNVKTYKDVLQNYNNLYMCYLNNKNILENNIIGK